MDEVQRHRVARQLRDARVKQEAKRVKQRQLRLFFGIGLLLLILLLVIGGAYEIQQSGQAIRTGMRQTFCSDEGYTLYSDQWQNCVNQAP